VAVGSFDQGDQVTEYWSELELINNGTEPRTATVTARHWNGQLIMRADYTLPAGGRQPVRIDNPSLHTALADAVYASVIVEPLVPEVQVNVRQLKLRGDKLNTTELSSSAFRYARDESRVLDTSHDGMGRHLLTNPEAEPRRVLSCQSQTRQNCTNTLLYEIPAYSTIAVPFAGKPYIFLTKPLSVQVGYYRPMEGPAATFHTDSSISFGATVEEKKK
jgi:hypothetical protein